MTTPMPIPPVSIRITTAEQSATHPAREGEKRVIEKITFHDEENDQQPTINSLDKNAAASKNNLLARFNNFSYNPATQEQHKDFHLWWVRRGL